LSTNESVFRSKPKSESVKEVPTNIRACSVRAARRGAAREGQEPQGGEARSAMARRGVGGGIVYLIHGSTRSQPPARLRKQVLGSARARVCVYRPLPSSLTYMHIRIFCTSATRCGNHSVATMYTRGGRRSLRFAPTVATCAPARARAHRAYYSLKRDYILYVYTVVRSFLNGASVIFNRAKVWLQVFLSYAPPRSISRTATFSKVLNLFHFKITTSSLVYSFF